MHWNKINKNVLQYGEQIAMDQIVLFLLGGGGGVVCVFKDNLFLSYEPTNKRGSKRKILDLEQISSWNHSKLF